MEKSRSNSSTESETTNTSTSSTSSSLAAHDFSFLLDEPKVYRFVGRSSKRPAPQKRKYDKLKAAATRERNKGLREAGKNVPPSYKRKTKRPYRQTGKYRGARVQKGGNVRQFKKKDLRYLNKIHSKFMTSEGKPHTFHGSKKKDSPK